VNGVLQAYVKASNPGGGAPHGPRPDPFNNGDEFGHSVALSDDTLVVGAPNEESCATSINGDQANNDCRDAGAVYVFTRSDNTWRQQAYMKASNTHLGDWFGWQVALNGDTLAVTALEEDGCARGVNGVPTSNDCFFAGAVYVFTRTNGEWSQQAYLKAANTDAHNGHGFGYSLALEGDTLAVGDYADASCATGINGDPNSDCLEPTGAAYVFVRTDGVWTQQAYFKRATRIPNGPLGFGLSVAVNGNTLAVGSTPDVNVYSRNNGTWTQEAVIQGSTAEIGFGFGHNMALSADTLALAATDVNIGVPTAVYVFTRSAGTWSQQAHHLQGSNTESGDSFGSSLALQGDTLAVSAEDEDSCATGINGNQADNSCSRAGAVYVFNRNTGVWGQQAYVKASNTDAEDAFGGVGTDNYGMRTVALSNGTLAIGAFRESSCSSGINGNQMDNNCVDAGAVYVYRGQ